MASKRFEKGSMEFSWFTDFWGMAQKHWIPEDKDEYWELLAEDVSKFSNKYMQTEEIALFTAYMRNALLNYLTGVQKLKHGGTDTSKLQITEKDIGRTVTLDSVWDTFIEYTRKKISA